MTYDELGREPNHDGRGPTARGRDILSFGLNFVKRPAMLGSVLPSSRYLVRRALRWIDWSRATLIVEYGPGVGTFTGEILRRMRSDARLLAFETNAAFVRRLNVALPDPRLEVMHESAERVEAAVRERGGGPVDYVLSGIPFSLMSDGSRDAILQHTHDVLAPDGAMLVYQFSPSIRSHLERTFADVQAEFEPRNFLPAMLFHCNRRSA